VTVDVITGRTFDRIDGVGDMGGLDGSSICRVVDGMVFCGGGPYGAPREQPYEHQGWVN